MIFGHSFTNVVTRIVKAWRCPGLVAKARERYPVGKTLEPTIVEQRVPTMMFGHSFTNVVTRIAKAWRCPSLVAKARERYPVRKTLEATTAGDQAPMKQAAWATAWAVKPHAVIPDGRLFWLYSHTCPEK
jgi:hypothetical protein